MTKYIHHFKKERKFFSYRPDALLIDTILLIYTRVIHLHYLHAEYIVTSKVIQTF